MPQVKVAAADQGWLKEMVTAEANRLASLQRAAVSQSLKTAKGVGVCPSCGGMGCDECEGEGTKDHSNPDSRFWAEHAKENKAASTHKAAEEPTILNTETAIKDHAFELKELAKQIASMTGQPDFPPNDPLKD
jgi:hypothetical protein